jgi:hypothetical protein
MKTLALLILIPVMISFAGHACATGGDWHASEVVSYSTLGGWPYDWPGAALGKPTTFFTETGTDVWACSMVVSAWNLAPPPYDPQDPNSGKIVTTVNPGGHLIVKFAMPIEDHPANWYGLDFIVYGNGRFTSVGEDFLTPDSDMEQIRIESDGEGWWEPSMVSVAQHPDGPWYDFNLSTDPRADDFAPLQAFAWDNINHAWGAELDFTRPVDPALTRQDFGNLTVAQAIDLYRGSAGGAAFDISRFPLPTNGNGRKWIQYIKVTGSRGEVDGFSRVSHAIQPVSVREAKNLDDGKPVIISNAVVTAGAADLGDCCYVQVDGRPCGIRLVGRALDRGQIATICGVMYTQGDERVVNVTAVESGEPGEIKPVGLANRSVGGGDAINPATLAVVQNGVDGGHGANTIGLLVRTWGRVGLVNTTARTWTMDDGSGCPIRCAAPPDPEFELPADGTFATVTGVCSCERNSSQESVPVIRLRDQQDLD